MRPLSLAVAVLLAAVAHAAYAESFAGSFNVTMPQFKFVPSKKEPAPFWYDLKASPRPRPSVPGLLVSRMGLAAQLDRHHYIVRLQYGSSLWDVGVAGDAAFKSYYLTFKQGDELRIAPLGDIKRLRNGVDIEIKPGLVYNFKLSLALIDPLRRSTLVMKPAKGTRGPSHNLKLGDVIDAVKRQSFIFSADGSEYWGFYGTDVDRNTGVLTDTRSFLFIHYNGLDSKAWPLNESALPVGQSVHVEMNSSLLLTRDDAVLAFSKP